MTGEVQAQAVCEILNLVLGPISLDLLGLHLRTNTIRIRLFATPDGLLGSLLCGLLGPIDLGNLAVLVGLLNDILCELTGGAVCP